MKLFAYQGTEGPRLGALHNDRHVDLQSADKRLPASLKELFAQGPDALGRLAAAVDSATEIEMENVRILPPVPDPQKIICVGLNYVDHAKETGGAAGEEPVIFNKFPTTLRADQEPIELPAVSDQVDYEAELVVVIGKQCRDVAREDALQFVGGYTCGHDVSARDWQKYKPGGQWLLGKSFDSFAPCGPYLVTSDEITDPGNLDISFRLNGETMQSSNTRQLIFPVDYLVAYLSQVCMLLPGDLLFTGTPSGVGLARDPQVFMKPGDVAEVEIGGIGVLRNPVKQRD